MLGVKSMITAATLGLLIGWWNQDIYVQSGMAELAPPDVRRAMLKMGPMKNYRVLPGGQLQVEVSGEWLNLRR